MPGSFPVCEGIAGELLSLPMFPELSVEQIQYVAQNIRRFSRAGLRSVTLGGSPAGLNQKVAGMKTA
jgi:hypothetical protein